MTEFDILEDLRKDDLRELFEKLRGGPMSASEIAEEFEWEKGECARILEHLNRRGSIKFEEEKWTVTDDGVKIYDKFFK